MTPLSPRILTWLRRLAYAAGGLVLLWALAWAVVPSIAKSQAQTRLSALLGRTVTIGAIEFAPWSLELTVRDLAVAKADGSGPQFSVARVYVDAEIQSLLRLAPVVDAVTIDSPRIALAHLGQGRYDIDDILQRLRTPPDAPATDPLRFAVYNVTLAGGSVDYTEQSLSGAPRQHQLRDLQLSLPFLSNFDSKREVLVVPRLAFVLNGSAFDTQAQGTPFAQTRQGEAQLRIRQFDLKPYLPYLPAGLPVQPQSAVVDAELKIGFVQQPQTAVTLSGVVTVSQLALADAAGAPLLSADTVRTELTDMRPLAQQVQLGSIEISNPRLQVLRARNGRLNLDLASADGSKSAPKKGAASANSTWATGQKDAKTPTTKPGWTVALERLALHGGRVDWQDQQTPAKLALTELEFTASGVHWPLDQAVQAELSATLPAGKSSARLTLQAQGTDQQGSAQATVNGLPLALADPYLAAWLEPTLRGLLDAELGAQWTGDKLQATVKKLAVRDAGLVASKAMASSANPRSNEGPSSQDLPQFKLLEVSDAQVDLAARRAHVGKLLLASASSGVRREADGQWMFARWLKKTGEAAPAAAATLTAAPSAPPAAPWSVALGELQVQDASVQFTDRVNARPVRLDISALNLQAKGAALDGKKPVPVMLSARVKSGQAEAGSLRYQGTVAWDPLQTQGALELLELPVHALAPYVASQVNLDVLRADASFKGQLRFAATPKGPELALKGDAQLEDFRANTVQGAAGSFAEELLSWKSLNVPGIDLAMVPGAATRVSVREAALSDFYARLIVNPNGRLNLQDLSKTPAQAEAAASAPAGAASAPAPAASATASATPDAIITMGPISLVHGRVLFSDRFIQPNYTADLSDLTGKLSQFSSQPAPGTQGAVQLADLELRGRAEGTASLEITGKLNPLAKPLALDIAGKVRDLELSPLSPYAVKYAGYGIERGKLSLDVRYAVQPDGQLTASNKLVLNQLSFGDKVDGAPNSLPVKLAVALLADRNGVIDLDLPISGSLNDPQFRIGPVVWKVITNLVAKAITAPFSLLANAFGGGSSAELSTVAFAPGSGALSDSAKAGLDKVAKALVDRPGLRLTVQGTAHLEAEREAIKRERLKGLLLAEKRRRATAQGQDAAVVTSYSAEEMPVLLRAVYRRADISKPRNLVGLTKDIEVPDMEALLLANISVNEEAARELALQRAVLVKDYLATRQVSAERLFLGAVKTGGPVADAKPQAELNLASQ